MSTNLLNNNSEKIVSQVPETYLLFLKQISLSFEPTQIVAQTPAPKSLLSGWQSIISLTCLDKREKLHDVEIRHAWSAEIWQQNLFDFNWNETQLLSKQKTTDSKLIVYLCEPETGLQEREKLEVVEQRYVIYPYWEKIEHLYLLLPLSHPFGKLTIPQEYFKNYATTKKLTIENRQSKEPSFFSQQLSLNPKRIEGGLRTRGSYKQDSVNQPLISVITVVFNGEQYLEQTIQSVINQSYNNLEYIIIDGGSTDNTLNIIQKYDEQIDYWISEPDRGIYDAMNKGTMLASGRYTLHINADDLLFQPNSLNLAYSDTNMAGLVLIFHPEERVFKKRLNRKIDSNEYVNAIRYPFHHQGFIGLRTNTSLFNTSYKIIADNLLMANKITAEKVTPLNSIIALHRREGVSAENNDAINSELLRAIAKTKNIRVLWHIYKKIIYSKLRNIAKALNLVSLKRKYL